MPQIALLLYDGMTALDAVGPCDVLARMPDADVRFAATTPGHKQTDAGLMLVADEAISDVPRPDIVLIPGSGQVPFVHDPEAVEWVRHAHETTKWTTRVCTGATLLGAAGILRGKRATTHWMIREALRDFGAAPVAERVVRDGKVITAAGVSTGIDMALNLAAAETSDDEARALQLVIEYDPQPPFDAGSPSNASPSTLERATEILMSGATASDDRAQPNGRSE